MPWGGVVALIVRSLAPLAMQARRSQLTVDVHIGRQKSYLCLYWVASETAFFRNATSDEPFSMDVSRFCRPVPFQKLSASERGSGRQILETSIANGSCEVAFLKNVISEATQHKHK